MPQWQLYIRQNFPTLHVRCHIYRIGIMASQCHNIVSLTIADQVVDEHVASNGSLSPWCQWFGHCQ